MRRSELNFIKIKCLCWQNISRYFTKKDDAIVKEVQYLILQKKNREYYYYYRLYGGFLCGYNTEYDEEHIRIYIG